MVFFLCYNIGKKLYLDIRVIFVWYAYYLLLEQNWIIIGVIMDGFLCPPPPLPRPFLDREGK